MSQRLEELLDEWEADAKVFRRHGDIVRAEIIAKMAQAVRSAASDYLTWLNEGDAYIQSGRSIRWLRAQFHEWEESGNARTDRGRKLFRQMIVPRKARHIDAYEAGRRAGAERASIAESQVPGPKTRGRGSKTGK